MAMDDDDKAHIDCDNEDDNKAHDNIDNDEEWEDWEEDGA
jgi:hypothetical protein